MVLYIENMACHTLEKIERPLGSSLFFVAETANITNASNRDMEYRLSFISFSCRKELK